MTSVNQALLETYKMVDEVSVTMETPHLFDLVNVSAVTDGNTTMTMVNSTLFGMEDNGIGVAGESSMEAASRIILRIVLPTICTSGILGIILTVIVLSRKSMCTSTNCYLMALAIADLLFLILLANWFIQHRFVPHSNAYTMFRIYATYAVIFMQVFLLTSIWLTVMLAVERYIAICRPFLATKICTVTRARIIIIGIYVFALMCRLPNFWEHKVVTYADPLTNTSLTFIMETDFAYDPNYMTVYPWFMDGVVASMLPFILLLMLNVRLIWEVRKSTQYIQRNLMVDGAANCVQKEELQITIMLISVIIVFFLCQAPYVIYTAIASINSYSSSTGITSSQTFMLFKAITKLLLTLKSAINFIIYCWFSEKFWATLKQIFCMQRCMPRKRKRSTSQNGSYYNLRRYSNCTRDTTI